MFVALRFKEPTMPRTPDRAGWWRFPAPTFLLFTLVVGVFPWVEVGCEGKPKDFEALNQNPMGGKKQGKPIGENGKVVLATQNGYQAIWGGTSPGPEIKEMQKEAEEESKKFAKQMGQPQPQVKVEQKPAKNKEDEPDSAPLLAVYFFLVLAAVAVGYAMPPGVWRSAAFAGVVGLAVMILGIQVAMGLPVKKQADNPKNGPGIKMQGADGFKMEVNPGGPKPYCRYTPWYYLSWPFLLLPLGLVGVEEALALVGRGGRKTKPKRRYEDDDADDDEDDRPRRRRRDDDDDDEDDDDRPRRRRRS
jgi:hypothetical protein